MAATKEALVPDSLSKDEILALAGRVLDIESRAVAALHQRLDEPLCRCL